MIAKITGMLRMHANFDFLKNVKEEKFCKISKMDEKKITRLAIEI